MAMKRTFIVGLVVAAAALTTSVDALAGAIRSPVDGVINSGGPGSGSLADTWNHNGLFTNFVSGVTDFDTYLAGNPLHTSVFAGYEWFSKFQTTVASVTYDLGAAYAIDRLALWNEESSGIGGLDLSYSTDGKTFLPLASGLAPFDNPLADYPAQVFPFAATSARYVRFDISGCPQRNPGSFESCAIGEVAFREADGQQIPEPATFALLGLGLALLAGRRRGA